MILVRFGEIGIKSRPVRRAFTKKLMKNIEEALKERGFEGFSVWTDSARIYIGGVKDSAACYLTHVFGITSISLSEVHSFSGLEDIVTISKKFAHQVKGKAFAVRVRRTGIHPFRSPDVERAVGAELIREGKVDLTNPQVTLYIEIREDRAYFFDRIFKGPGGLPIGTQGRVLSLLSGGFDSALASWYLMKRGTEVDFLFLNLGGPPHLIGAARVAQFLRKEWGYGYPSRFLFIDGRTLVRELEERVNPHYWNLILKRVLYEAAQKVGKMMGHQAIVTGESLGQVSSQTLTNLASVSIGIEVPILRPLLGFDKEEIVKLCREIGTYQLSESVKEYCQLVPKHPKTHASHEHIMGERRKLKEDIVEELVSTLSEMDLSHPLGGKIDERVEIDKVPENALVIDVRPGLEYERWHYPGALNLSWEGIDKFLQEVPKKRPLVLYCSHGIESKMWAIFLRSKGVEAYSLKGGVEALDMQRGRNSAS